ncbi:glycosyltransferase [Patulibacter minatonensis]|uniref:glycosyltransferase n=1 Tax=Patulibacter minatonensis TaxID=298163 RepID=UPI00047A6496|nr:glycosyltransferase [Patulibacter minatonensis]
MRTGPSGPTPRVLAISSLYPPHHLGGYELVHRGVDERLRAAGHAVRVLVTDHAEAGAVERGLPDDPDVHRELRWYWRDHAFPALTARETVRLERHNHRVLRRHLAEHRPDVVVFWAMGGMSLSLIGAVTRAGIPAVFVVHDRWPIYGPVFDRFRRLLRPLPRGRGPVARALGADRPGMPGGVVLLNSLRLADELVRTRSIPPGWRVLSPGVPLPDAPVPERPWTGRLLCLGRLDHRKGVDVVVDALARLPHDVSLTVVGGGDERVAADLRRRAEDAGTGDRLELRPAVDRSALPTLFAEHDALVFPVRWSEPFGLVPLEAMSFGLPVVSTDVGGQAEYLDDGDNALVVPVDDPAAVASAVARLAADPGLGSRLRSGGLRTAAAHDERDFQAGVEAAIVRAARR